MIVDVHVHLFPDALAPRAVATLARDGGLPPYGNGQWSDYQQAAQAAGVDIAVVQPVATRPGQADGINRYFQELAQRDNRILPFGALYPWDACVTQDLDQLYQAGVRGVKLHPDYQDFDVDDPRIFPVYRQLAERGLVALFHCGRDIAYPPPWRCTPQKLARALDAVPELTVIAAHLGGYELWQDARLLAGRENLYFDCSMSVHQQGRERVNALMHTLGLERILFGSDWPWDDVPSAVAHIRGLGFTAQQTTDILGGNAARLLRLPVMDANDDQAM